MEQYPLGSKRLGQLITQCEVAIQSEQPQDLSDELDYYSTRSYEICQRITKVFEAKYHLINYAGYINDPNHPGLLQVPHYQQQLTLSSPQLEVPSAVPGYDSLKVTSKRPLSIEYLGIIVSNTNVVNAIDYTGPHLMGILDTSVVDSVSLNETLGHNDRYTFVTPLKHLAIADQYIPSAMN